MISRARALLRLVGYAAWSVVLLPVQMLSVAMGWRLGRRLPIAYHRGTCRILGVEIERRGQASTQPGTLFVANHSSYLDISILGALLEASFVAKAEVADWPVYGLFARLQRTVFVARRRRGAQVERDRMRARLDAGDNLILFPEGTSSDGNRVLPFRSTFFSVAEAGAGAAPLTIQPVSIAYTRLNGLPLGRNLRPYFAWYGDMDLASHAWAVMGLGKVSAVVEFHACVTIAAFGSRKALAAHCERAVALGVSSAISGRWPRAAADTVDEPLTEAPAHP